MTVLEFVSHLDSKVSVRITNLSSNCFVHGQAQDLERQEYSGCHDWRVVDWNFSRDGVARLEAQDV